MIINQFLPRLLQGRFVSLPLHSLFDLCHYVGVGFVYPQQLTKQQYVLISRTSVPTCIRNPGNSFYFYFFYHKLQDFLESVGKLASDSVVNIGFAEIPI